MRVIGCVIATTEGARNVICVKVKGRSRKKLPRESKTWMLQNYPNPFNPSTEIKFSVEKTSWTTLHLYNILGQSIATLFDDIAEAGKYHRVKVDGTNLASGLYVYKLQSGVKTQVKKMLLLK